MSSFSETTGAPQTPQEDDMQALVTQFINNKFTEVKTQYDVEFRKLVGDSTAERAAMLYLEWDKRVEPKTREEFYLVALYFVVVWTDEGRFAAETLGDLAWRETLAALKALDVWRYDGAVRLAELALHWAVTSEDRDIARFCGGLVAAARMRSEKDSVYDLAQIILDFERPCLVFEVSRVNTAAVGRLERVLDAANRQAEKYQENTGRSDIQYLKSIQDDIASVAKCLQVALQKYLFGTGKWAVEYLGAALGRSEMILFEFADALVDHAEDSIKKLEREFFNGSNLEKEITAALLELDRLIEADESYESTARDFPLEVFRQLAPFNVELLRGPEGTVTTRRRLRATLDGYLEGARRNAIDAAVKLSKDSEIPQLRSALELIAGRLRKTPAVADVYQESYSTRLKVDAIRPKIASAKRELKSLEPVTTAQKEQKTKLETEFSSQRDTSSETVRFFKNIKGRAITLRSDIAEWRDAKDAIVKRAEKLKESFEQTPAFNNDANDLKNRSLAELEQLLAKDDPKERQIGELEKQFAAYERRNAAAKALDERFKALERDSREAREYLNSVPPLPAALNMQKEALLTGLETAQKAAGGTVKTGGAVQKWGQVLTDFDAFAINVTAWQERRLDLENKFAALLSDIEKATDSADDLVFGALSVLESDIKNALRNPDAKEADFAGFRARLEQQEFNIKGIQETQRLERAREAAKQEAERLLQAVRESTKAGDSQPLRRDARQLEKDIGVLTASPFTEIPEPFQQRLDALVTAVDADRAERRAQVREAIETAVEAKNLKLISGEVRRHAFYLGLMADISGAEEIVAQLLERDKRIDAARVERENADDAAAVKNTALAAAGDSRRTFAQRYDAAKAAQAASAEEKELLQQALAILDPAEDWESFDPLDARLRGLKDYADLVASTHAAYLRQLEIERKEGLARKLRAGEVPLGAAPEPAEAPKPLRDAEQEKAAHELARFMREEPLWYDVYEKWKLHWRRCVNGHRFLEIDNVGSWACRQHALPFDHRAQRFPCCDKAERDPGCVRADHRVTEAPLTEAHNISGVKDLILRAMEGDRPGRAPPGDFVRFDRAEHARRARPVIHWKERHSKTVSVLLPDFLTLERDPADENRVLGGAAGAPADMWLWDWAAPRPETTAPPAGAPVSARIIYLDQLSEFIYNQTKDTVTFKVALLVEDVPVLFQHGRRGVPYRTHPHRPLEFTPLERVRLWASSPR